MQIKLEHPAIPRIPCLPALLGPGPRIPNVVQFSTFISRINDYADRIALGEQNLYIPSADDLTHNPTAQDQANKFKGDVFEIFCELLIKLSPIDDRFGIHDYRVAPDNEVGVDGSGLTKDGRPCTVQIKYRQWDHLLKFEPEHLDNFKYISQQKYHVDPQSDDQMLLITAGEGIHWKTADRYFAGRVRCLSLDASYGCIKGAQKKTIDHLFSLKTLVNGNIFFWDTLRSLTSKV